MAAKTEKSEVLHYLKASFNELTSKKQPAANIIDGNVQLHVLFHIPDNFQGVTEIVSDGLPKPSKVNIVTKTYKVLLAQQNTIDLRPEDLSTKGLERFHGKWCKKAAYQISVCPII